MSNDFTYLARYLTDPVFHAVEVAEQERQRAISHATIDQGMAPLNAKQAARWEREDA